MIRVATAIVFIGGVIVSASVFPRYGLAAAPFADIGGHPSALAIRRITKGYGRPAIITSVVGLVLSLLMGRLAEP